MAIFVTSGSSFELPSFTLLMGFVKGLSKAGYFVKNRRGALNVLHGRTDAE